MKKIRENGRLIWLTTFVVTLVIISVFFTLRIYTQKINEKVESYTSHYLTDIMQENTQRISQKLESNFQVLDTLAISVGRYDDPLGEDVKNLLADSVGDMKAKKLDVVIKNGQSLQGETETADMLKQEYFIKAFNGKNTVSDIITSRLDDSKEIIFNVPVIGKKGNIVAVLQGIYDIEGFSDVIGDSVFSDKADTFILQQDGNLVTKPSNVNAKNMFSLLQIVAPDKQNVIAKLEHEIKVGNTGFYVIGEGSQKRYICYNRISLNNWYSVTIMTYNAVEQDISQVSRMGNNIRNTVIGILVVLIICIFVLYIRAWNKASFNTQRYKVMAALSDNVIFEYDCGNHTAIFNDVWETTYDQKVQMHDFMKEMIESHVIAQMDEEGFQKAFQEIEHGSDGISKEIRLINKNGETVWNRLDMIAMKNKKGENTRIIGQFANIHQSKLMIEYLKEQSQIDLSTGLYNKETTNKLISKAISEGKGPQTALLYLDIDDFKLINDQFGHNFGDHLIRTFALVLKDTIPDTAFAGRVGGDEFVVVLTGLSGKEEAVACANALLAACEGEKFQHHKEAKLAISIGIAMVNPKEDTPQTLIKRADMAMFHAKKEGKRCYVLSGDTADDSADKNV